MRPRHRKKEAPPKRERVNEQIRLPEVQVIDHNGDNLGTISSDRAREIAREAGLDLVEINPNTRPPICKIMDYGKWKYEQSKKSHDAKKKQHQIKIKEVRLTPKTEEHDLSVKIDRIRGFLEGGDKVQISIQFKGREIVHKSRGEMQMQRIIAEVADVGKPESPLQMQGRRMIILIAPDKKAVAAAQKAKEKEKKDAKAIAESAQSKRQKKAESKRMKQAEADKAKDEVIEDAAGDTGGKTEKAGK